MWSFFVFWNWVSSWMAKTMPCQVVKEEKNKNNPTCNCTIQILNAAIMDAIDSKCLAMAMQNTTRMMEVEWIFFVDLREVH